MIKTIKTLSLMLGAALLATSCSDDDNNGVTNPVDADEAALQAVVTDYVNNTVVPTYRGLADASVKLADLCDAMCDAGVANLTEAKIAEAGDAWIEARRYWELSEAWLYGQSSLM